MKGTDITGIIVLSIMGLLIIGLIIFGFSYHSSVKKCEDYESPFCYLIQCPCDIDTTINPPVALPPCFGYAKMSMGSGKWICANAPNSIVDDKGNVIN